MKVRFLVPALAALMCNSCGLLLHEAINHADDEPRRGSLSEVIAKASNTYKGERKVVEAIPRPSSWGPRFPDPPRVPVPVIRIHDDECDRESRVIVIESSSRQTVTTPTPRPSSYLGIRVDGGVTGPHPYGGIGGVSLVWAQVPQDRKRWSLEVGASAVPLSPTDKLHESMTGFMVLHGGVHRRRYMTPDNTAFGCYTTLGLQLRSVNWLYNNPVDAVSTDEYGNEIGTNTVLADGIFGARLRTGIGFCPVQNDVVSLSIEPGIDLGLHFPETYEGFTNDYFGPDATFRVSVELAFRR